MNEFLKVVLKRVAPLVWSVRFGRRVLLGCQRRRQRSRAVWSRQIANYLAAQAVRKLHIGAGPHTLGGWLNVDLEPPQREVVFLDATKPFPLPDRSIDYIFSEHMIEHISHADGMRMLGESFRVLKPLGTIRIATPNLENLVSLYHADKTGLPQQFIEKARREYFPEWPPCPGFALNNFVRNWGHQFIYDPTTLRVSLERAGFDEVRACAVGQSEHTALRGLESHGKLIGEAFNEFETMVLEARRPPAG